MPISVDTQKLFSFIFLDRPARIFHNVSLSTKFEFQNFSISQISKQVTKHNLKQVKLLEQLNTTHADCRFIWYSSPTLWPSFDVMMTLWNLKVASIIRFGQMQMHRQPKQASNHHQRDQHLPLPAFWSDRQDSLFWFHCWHFAVSYRHIILPDCVKLHFWC